MVVVMAAWAALVVLAALARLPVGAGLAARVLATVRPAPASVASAMAERDMATQAALAWAVRLARWVPRALAGLAMAAPRALALAA